MSIGRRAVAAVISLVIVAASWVLGLGAFLWTFAATDFRWIAFAVSVLVAWIACMAIQLPFIFWRRAAQPSTSLWRRGGSAAPGPVADDL